MFENIRKKKIIRSRFKRWKRQIEDVREYTKDEDYKKKIKKMAKTNRRYSRKQRLQKKILKMNIREDFPAEIDDEDVRQVFQNFL